MVDGGSLPDRQAFPACEATATERMGGGGGSKEGGRAETKPSMRYGVGLNIKGRRRRSKPSKQPIIVTLSLLYHFPLLEVK